MLRPLSHRVPLQSFRASQVHGQLRNDKERDPFRAARGLILDWAQERLVGKTIPPAAYNGENVEIVQPGTPSLQVASNCKIWAMQFSLSGENSYQWTTEATLLEHKGNVYLGVNLICSFPESEYAPLRNIPKFVSIIANRIGLTDYGQPVDHNYVLVEDAGGCERLKNLIENPERTRSVIVASLQPQQTSPAQAALNVTHLAQQAGMLAHVFVLTGPASWGFSDAMGPDWSVYNGAVRTYCPGFDRNRDEPFAHPVARSTTIKAWPSSGERAYRSHLFQQAAEISVANNPEARVPGFSSIRQHLLRAQMAAAPSEQNPDDVVVLRNRIQVLKNLNAQLVVENTAAWQEAIGLDRQLTEARQEIAALRDERDHLLGLSGQLRQRVSHQPGQIDIVSMWRENKADIVRHFPKSYGEMRDWVETHLADKLILLPKAFAAVKESVYEDVPLVYKALLLLACEYGDMRQKGGSHAHRLFESRCRELHLEFTPAFDKKNPGVKIADYTVRYGDHRLVLDWHLKKSNKTHDPRRCFRVYMSEDPQTKRPIIGHLTTHLKSSLT